APMNQIRYSLVDQGNVPTYFSIDPSTAAITLKKDLPPSGISGFQVQVLAQDGGFPAQRAICNVQVSVTTDSGTLGFVLPDYPGNINENAAINDNVVLATASPRDSVTYSVVGIDTGPTYFDINPSTGQIFVKKNLRDDPSKRTQYILRLKAVRQFQVTTQEAFATATITVNRNLNAPELRPNNLYEETINEDAFIGNEVIQIDAIDKDNDTLRYTVQNPTSGSDFFAVSATTGQITVAKPLTSVPQNPVQFNVIVSDQAIVNPKSTIAIIRISIVPDARPQFVNPNSYSTSISFNQPASASIFKVSATDSDLKGAIVYEANCGTLSAPGYFDVDRVSGDISITNSVALDLAFTYELCLIAYDSQRPNAQATATMTINVNRNPNAPEFNPTSYQNDTTEIADYGTVMFTLTATDRDAQAIEYRITASSPTLCGNYFNLHPDTGVLSTAGDLVDLLPKSITQCNFQFAASDRGNPSRPAVNTASGLVSIGRNNFSPAFPRDDYTINIPETTSINTIVFNANATDGDFGEVNFGDVDYVAIGDSPALNFFQVNAVDGTIRVINNLVSNNIASYQVRVVARDMGRPRLSGTTLVTINIDRNFADPVILPDQSIASTDVFEDDPIVNPIFEFNYRDTDRAGPQRDVTWNIQFPTASDSRFFNIDQQGDVFISVPLYFDESDKTIYTFTVTATNTDGSGKSDSVNCQVNVKRNTNTPTFTQGIYTVTPDLSYEAGRGTVVTNALVVTDNDNEARYKVQRISIVQDLLYSNLFDINSVSGQIVLAQSLQGRRENEYKIRVQAQDGGTPPLIGYTTVQIPVNLNQRRPRFITGNQTITLLETQAGGEIGTVQAVDEDSLEPYNKLEYTQTTRTTFYSTDSDGKIYLIRSLTEPGSEDSFVLQIRVCDLAPSSLCADSDAYVTINVIRNNHSPYFLPSPNYPYRSNRDTISPGQIVITARAADDDPGNTPFGQFTFALIGDDGDQNRFDINPSSGEITVSNRASQGESSPFQLRIQVCDGGGLCNVTVALISVTSNQFAPILGLPEYSDVVWETQEYGVAIITVVASDSDAGSPNNVIEYELQAGPTNDVSLSCFGINRDNGQIFAKVSLLNAPCDTLQIFRFNVQAKDKGDPVRSSQAAPVTITVIRNTAAPEWEQSLYTINMDKNQSLNTQVGSGRATDGDPVNTPFGTLKYTVKGASSPLTFDVEQVDNNNVNIMLRRSLEGSFLTNYKLYVLVEDGGVPSLSQLTVFDINVNRNLNRPFFRQTVYTFDVFEHDPVGTGVGTQLLGDDLDTQAPWNVYAFRLRTASQFFTLDTSGQLYISRTLVGSGTGTASRTFPLQAQIYDGGDPSLIGLQEATITVRVFYNLNCPSFGSNLPATVNILQTDNGVIFTAVATDADTEPFYNKVTYELAGVNPNVTRFFNFDRNNGQVSVLPTMARDQATSYAMVINAWDGYCTTRTQGKLTINVERNLFAPQWRQDTQSITLLETQQMGAPIYDLRLQALDQDLNSVLRYSFAAGSSGTNMFFLGSEARVYLRQSFLGRNDDPYSMQFILTDDGGLTSGVFTLNVNVIRNQPPTISIDPTVYNIRGDASINDVIGTCQGFDPDTQVPFSRFGYYLTGIGDAMDFFAVNEQNCQIRIANDLSGDSATSYRLELQVRDEGTPPLTNSITIVVNVERNLFSPVFQPDVYSEVIVETIPQGEIFATVTARDADALAPYNTVRYSIVNPGSQDVLTYFDINPITGGIFCKVWQVNYPDNLPNNPFTFEVQATDMGPVPKTSVVNARVSVDVIRNTAPFFLNTASYLVSIPETQPEGSSVYAVTFSDNDRTSPFNALTLDVRGDGNAATFFNIDNNGVIRLKNAVDLPGSTETSFKVRVQVEDGGIPPLSAEAIVTINVLRNFNTPELPSESVSIPYNSFRGRLVTTLKGSDRDGTGPEGTISYSVLGGDSAGGITYFYLNPSSGALTLTDNTDLKNIDSFIIRVRATDAGTPPRFADATVTVTILKETSNLTIPDYNLQVDENRSAQFPITSLVATPSDGVRYITIGFEPATNFFAVDSSSGQLSVKTSLLGEDLTRYTLVVRAVRDSGLTSQTAESTVTINVERNQNGPVFNASRYEKTIQDTTDIGSLILTVFAEDQDGDAIEYAVVPNSGDSSPFFLHPRSGELSLMTSMLGITSATYTFRVSATDNRRPVKSQEATVVVFVVGDRFPPSFSQPVYPADFDESSVLNDGISVLASDQDLRGVLKFEITGISTGPAYFGLGTVTPLQGNQASARVVLTDVANLRADDLLSYTLRVIAYDSRYPNNQATATVTVRMARNPSDPDFTAPSYFTTVKETIPEGTIIFSNINATDADGDPLRFSITGNTQAQEYYVIHPDTAVIRLKKSLKLGSQNSDTIQLLVTDQRNPVRTASRIARVEITRAGIRPQFTNLDGQEFVNINTAAPSNNIYTIRAQDGDLKGDLVYTWVSGYSDFFELVNVGSGASAVGEINLIRPLSNDTLRLESYELKFRVHDSEFPDSFDEKTLTVTTDRNPTIPRCPRPTITRQIDVNTKLNEVLDTIQATDGDGFTVLANDQGYPRAKECPVVVRFTVDTDDAPYFRPLNYTWTGLRENAFDLQSTFEVNGFDDDIQGNLQYKIVGQYSEPYYFGVRRSVPSSPTSSGTIFLQNDLLPDNEDIYYINVVVYDDARPQLSATTTVTASVLRNPSGPSYLRFPANYAATFHEQEPVGYNPVNVTAVDSDGDTVTYSFITVGVDLKPLEYFDIQPLTGEIAVKKSLTEDPNRQSYVLRVQAVDDREPRKSAQASVTLTVLRNQNSPVFVNTPYELINPSLSENTVPGPTVLYSTIEAVDTDNRLPLVYEVIANTSGAYFFNVDRNTGDLTLRNSLLFGASQLYTLYVRAYDPAYPQDYAEEDVVISVARNEYSPSFLLPSYSVRINETEPVGTNILTIQATDQNAGDIVTFSATGFQDTLELFELFSSGKIIVKKSLLELPKSVYQMVVVARDDGTPQKSTQTTVTINIIQYPGDPQILTRPCQQTFSENLPLGPIGTRISVQDNPAGVLVYEETGQYPAPSFFEIDNQGVISLTRNVRNSTFKGNAFSYSVRVSDSLRPNRASEVTCTFTIIRNRNLPTWDIDDFSTRIKDSHPVLGDVVAVTASDIDPLDRIEYSLESETLQRNLVSGPSDYFFINEDTGMIRLSQSVKGSGIQSFTLTVKACDNGYPEHCITKTGVITVDYTGAVPVFRPPSYSEQIEETAKPGDFVLRVTATDADMLPTSYLVYEFADPPPAYFLLDERTGNLTVARSVLYDISASYGFRVIAYDVSDPDRKATAEVTVLVNRNPAGPVCQRNPDNIILLEYQPVPSIIGRVDAQDQNRDVLEYTLVSVTPPPSNVINPDYYVDFRTGDIWLFNSWEGTNTTDIQLNVRVADKRNFNVKSDDCIVNIKVILDSPPYFNQNNPDRSISEYRGLGEVTNVVADDNDIKGVIIYNLVGVYPADAFFNVNPVTGSVTLIKSLTQDGLGLGSYTLTIEAYDNARPKRIARRNVVITVARNANGPEFLPTATYSEREPVTFNITSSTGNGLDVFFMDGDTIRTKADLRQAADFYQLTIQASDPRGSTNNATASIGIDRVVADRPPQFSRPTYTANINRYEAVNNVVISSFATDPDIPNQQSRIKYEMNSITGYSYFSMNRDTGAISLDQALTQNVNEAAFYTYELTAFDEQNPDSKATADAVIFVDFNPNTPVPLQPSYSASISEYFDLGRSVLTVNATDADGDVVRYSMDQITNDGRIATEYFSVDPDDGTVFAIKALTSAPQDRIQFRVIAYDNRTPVKSSSVPVAINILRDRFTPSCFQRVSQNVNENTVVNATSALFRFQASDADNTGLPFVFMATGNRPSRAYFRVTSDGSVFVNFPLTTSTLNTFELEASVYQEGLPQKVGTCFATLSILRNSNAPDFTADFVREEVWEYRPIGFEVANVEATDADGDQVRYFISGDPIDLEYFTVDDLTGRLTLRKPLSENQVINSYSFNIIGTDDRTPPQSGSIPVTVNVRRDVPPQFINPTPRSIVVDEADTRGTVLSPAATATDSDIIGQIRYGSTGQNNAKAFFEIDEFTGAIRIIRDLSEDITESYQLVIYAYDSRLPQVRSQPWTIFITVTRNQFPPNFVGDPYFFSIDIDKDGNNLGYVIGRVNATDLDGDIPYYTIRATDNSGSYIFLDRNSGILYLISSLSSLPTSQQEFLFSVVASDRFVNPKTDIAQVNVSLRRDQFPPEFNPTVYSATIQESRPVNDVIVLRPAMSATDGDLQGAINYEVTGTYPANNFFDVGLTDGSLRIIKDLKEDTTARENYVLTVVAFDNALPSAKATATVSISVLRNINVPAFSPNPVFASVDETHPIQNLVTNISATDRDGDTVEYRLLRDRNSNGDGLSFFYVETSTGEMYIKRSLTQARSNNYNLVVRATDSGNPPKSADVDVFVTIRRINPPGFLQRRYTTSVPENLPVSSSVYDQMIATKPGATVRYEATGEGLAPYFFAINESTGLVTVKNSLRNFREMSYSLTVKAYDVLFPDFPATARLDISVSRNDNEPAFNQSLYEASVAVDTQVFTNLVTVNAEDARDGDIITYSQQGPQQCLDSFRLLPTTGQFLLVVDPSTIPEGIIDCRVRATDNGYPLPRTADATVRVTVTTQNAPIMTQPDPVRVPETRLPGQVATLSASKVGGTVGDLRYEAVGVYPALSFFNVDPTTGVVSLTGDLLKDPSKMTQYTLRVCAFDTAFPNLRTCRDLIINVDRNANGPTFSPPFRFSLPVNTNPDQWARIIQVSDPDSTDLKCSLIGDAKAQAFFAVDSDKCVLSLIQPLTDDPANTTLYRLTIEATDNGTPQARTETATYEVSVNRDIFPPEILNLPDEQSIPENTPAGGSVFRVQTRDRDQSGQIVCESVANYPASIYFRVDPRTCEVFVENSVKSDDSSVYTIPIQVYDSAWPENRRTGVLTIRPSRNENGPSIFGSTTANINDLFPPGDVVLTLSAQDNDGDTLTFSKVDPSDPQGTPFIVDGSSGRIILVEPLRGGRSQYTFDVQVSDNRNPPKTATTTVTVNVAPSASIRWNNPPFGTNININQQVNSVFNAGVSASKAGSTAGIKYRVSGSAPSTAVNFFNINENTGTFTLTNSLVNSQNMAQLSSVVLFIEAYDENAPSDIIASWVTVTFNRNLNAPQFTLKTYPGSVADYDAPGTSVTTVSATDGDALPPESNVLYSLSSDSRSASDWFTVNSYTGQVSVARRLSEDASRPNSYQLLVVASDPSLSPLSATATVNINVERNQAPRFLERSYSSPAPDSLDIFSTILVASATDGNPSNSQNGILDFFIDDATAQSIFFINNQGAISPRRQLDRLSQTLYEFPIRVADRGIPSLSATSSVTISIRESQGLVFRPDEVRYQKPENNPVPELLENTQATDGAAGNQIFYELQSDGFGNLAYSIVNNTGEIFQIRPFTDDPARSLRYV
ncbi:protocadherin Fat 4, partial [Elysia marginata]